MSSSATANPPAQRTELLFLHAQTSLHPGSGTALGVVDLPIQRERHTQWPTIPGSTLKGILRDACREKAKEQYQDEYEDAQDSGGTKRKLKRTRRRVANEDDPLLVAAFGPGKVGDDSSSHAGALSLTDARILAFPVRSLRGVFAWITCPAVLERLSRDLRLTRQDASALAQVPRPADTEFVVTPQERHPLLVDGNKLVLEEYEFTQKPSSTLPEAVIRVVKQAVDSLSQNQVENRLVLLNDDYFTHFVRHATEIVARIGLDYERKTVKQGALFYQECLPAETLFYSVVFANASRREDDPRTARQILDYVADRLREVQVLQIGGDETTGKGLCAVRLTAPQASE